MFKINKNKIPYHVGFIMDGNGRWAQKRLLPRLAGHKAGVEALKRVTSAARELGIKELSFFAFSTVGYFFILVPHFSFFIYIVFIIPQFLILPP